MNELLSNSMYFGFCLTLGTYMVGTWISKKTALTICNPLLLSILFVILILKLFGIDYATFEHGAKYITYLLNPATVCLALPLYRKFEILKQEKLAVVSGILAGAISCMILVLVMAAALHLNPAIKASLLPKSITTAIAMGVSEELGGIANITVMSVVITGIFGAVISKVIFKLFRIQEPVAKGLALGTAAHAIGTSKAIELGEVEAAMSSLAIVVTGGFTVIFAPILFRFFGA